MTWLEYKHNVLNAGFPKEQCTVTYTANDLQPEGEFAEGMCKYGGYTIAEIKKAKELMDSKTTDQEREVIGGKRKIRKEVERKGAERRKGKDYQRRKR